MTTVQKSNIKEILIKLTITLVPVMATVIGWGISTIYGIKSDLVELRIKADDMKEIKADLKESKNLLQDMNIRFTKLESDFSNYKAMKGVK